MDEQSFIKRLTTATLWPRINIPVFLRRAYRWGQKTPGVSRAESQTVTTATAGGKVEIYDTFYVWCEACAVPPPVLRSPLRPPAEQRSVMAWAFLPPPISVASRRPCQRRCGAASPPTQVAPQRPDRPACGGARCCRASLQPLPRLPLGAAGWRRGPRFAAAARRLPSRRPPATAPVGRDAADRRLWSVGSRRQRRRDAATDGGGGDVDAGGGSGTAVAATATRCRDSENFAGDARGTG